MDTKTFVISLQDIRISLSSTGDASPYWTTKVACPRAPPQVTSIGHVPVVVFPPIVQIQVTAPAPSDVLSVKPCALLAPVLYVTTMLHEMFGAVATTTKPVPFGDTGDRTEVKTTPNGFAVGAAVTGARVGGACVARAAVAGACVGAALLAATDPVGAAGATVVEARLRADGTGVTAACAAGTIPASRAAGLPHPASANRAIQIATENRFPKSHPSLNPL